MKRAYSLFIKKKITKREEQLVYSIKFNKKGEVVRYKAQLVAKRYTQIHGIDFHETFSPITKLNMVRVILSLAANFDWPLHQFNEKNAFLHSDLEEEIYMDMPLGYTDRGSRTKLCKLRRRCTDLSNHLEHGLEDSERQ